MELGYAVYDEAGNKYHEGGHGFHKSILKAKFHKTIEEARDSRDYAADIYGDEVELKIIAVNLGWVHVE